MILDNEMERAKFIFLYGISVRSGTNFSARIFSKHPDVEIVPNNETIREFPLLKVMNHFKNDFERFGDLYTRNNGVKSHYNWGKYASHFGNSFLDYILAEHIIDMTKKIYFLKDPGSSNLKFSGSIFPNNKVIILIRDGRDLVESSEKAYLNKRGGQSFINRIKRNVFHFTGREFRRNVRQWNINANQIKQYINSEAGKNCLVVKYEDLQRENEETYKKLFDFCGLSFDMTNFKSIEVVGSSFSDQISSDIQNRTIWSPIEKNEQFKPIGRWANWSNWKIKYFQKNAGEMMAWFDY